MANEQMKPVATLLLLLNFCMYVIVLGVGAWAMNRAIDHGFIIDGALTLATVNKVIEHSKPTIRSFGACLENVSGPGLELPAHFSPIFFPMGNAATGFFVTFALIAGVVGVASVISGMNHVRSWTPRSLPSASSAAAIAWTLTVLAMGFACKEIELRIRNARLRTMEAFLIILSATQLLYIAVIHRAAST